MRIETFSAQQAGAVAAAALSVDGNITITNVSGTAECYWVQFDESTALPEELAQVTAAASLPTYTELAEALKAAQMPLALYRGYGWPDRNGVVRKIDDLVARLQA